MTCDKTVDLRPVNSILTLQAYEPAAIYRSKQYFARNGSNKKLRLAQVAIEDRLNKVDSNLRMLKAKLKTKEEQLRASRKISKSIMTVEKELRIKIEKAKEELSAKEKQAAARRTKKNNIRDDWAKKQMADYEQREAKQQAQAKMDSGVETASAGAAMAASYEDFDIDVYGD
jgi:peptidoglycan hydrolase CwlO-like protein